MLRASASAPGRPANIRSFARAPDAKHRRCSAASGQPGRSADHLTRPPTSVRLRSPRLSCDELPSRVAVFRERNDVHDAGSLGARLLREPAREKEVSGEHPLERGSLIALKRDSHSSSISSWAAVKKEQRRTGSGRRGESKQ